MLKNLTRYVFIILPSVLLGFALGLNFSAESQKTAAPVTHSLQTAAKQPIKNRPPPLSQSSNYCHDAEKNKVWEGMIIKYEGDLGITKLYGLRLGLCKAVDERKIDLDTAIDVFNSEHQKLWQERFEKEQREKTHKEMGI